jgi:hypothetical protein
MLTQGAKSPHEAILLVQSPQHAAVRMGDWKLLVNAGQAGSDETPSPSPRAKVKAKAKARKAAKADSPVSLYNLATDVSEKTDLAASEPERVAALQAKLQEFLKNAAPPGHLGLQDDTAKKAKKEIAP